MQLAVNRPHFVHSGILLEVKKELVSRHRQLLHDDEVLGSECLFLIGWLWGVATAVFEDGNLDGRVAEPDNHRRQVTLSSFGSCVHSIAGFDGVLNLRDRADVSG